MFNRLNKNEFEINTKKEGKNTNNIDLLKGFEVEFLKTTFKLFDRPSDLSNAALVCKRWKNAATETLLFYRSQLKNFIDNEFALHSFGQSWVKTYQQHIKRLSSLADHKEIKKHISHQDLVTHKQTWNTENYYINPDAALYLYHVHKISLPLAFAGASAWELSVKNADIIADFLKHPAMSYYFAKCVSHILVLKKENNYYELAIKLLETAQQTLGVNKTCMMFNKWFYTGEEFPKNLSYNINHDYSHTRYEFDLNIENDLKMAEHFLKIYKEYSQFTYPSIKFYPDHMLKNLIHFEMFSVKEIANEILRRIKLSPKKYEIGSNSGSILKEIVNCCPTVEAQQKFDEYLNKDLIQESDALSKGCKMM